MYYRRLCAEFRGTGLVLEYELGLWENKLAFYLLFVSLRQ